MPNLRLIPVVLFATVCLLAIKTIGFVGSKGPTESTWNLEREIWQRVAGGPMSDADPVITGATPETKNKDKAKDTSAAVPKTLPASKSKSPTIEPKSESGAERALIERLQERRQELEARARDLEMREHLLKAAEKQLDARIGELKATEGAEGEAAARIKSLVIMYESMGPKEAARIFDRLDPRTMVDLVNNMNPRKVSEIMGKMQPQAAERLTLELARGNRGEKALPATDLPRIGAKGGR